MLSVIGFMVLIASGFTLIPAGLLLVLNKRTQNRPLSDRAAYRLLHSLLATVIVVMMAMYALEHSGWIGDSAYLFGAPLMITSIIIACLHIDRTPVLRNRRTVFIVLSYLTTAVVITIWHMQTADPYVATNSLSIILAFVSAGLIIALIWRTVEGHNRWLWLILGILIAAISIQNFAYNGMLETWPGWILWLLDIASTFLIPVVLIALVGRVAAYLADTPHVTQWQKWIAGGIVALLMIVLLVIHIVDMFLLDGFDDWGPIVLPLFFGIVAITVALTLIWTLQHYRIRAALTYALVMLAIIFTLFAVINTINTDPTIDMVTRAEQIDQSIQAYYADNGHYPAGLYDLIPRYMLTIPNPVLFNDRHVWCYEGGSEFYRLGYVSRAVWGAPPYTFSIQIQNSAGILPSESWMCDARLAEYQARYTDLGILRQS